MPSIPNRQLLPLILSCSVAFASPATAQLVPDSTLGTESSLVTPNTDVRGLPADLIQGGAARGANLYHSFSEFNINDLQRVYFANPAGIESILTRVTGANPSVVLGTLGVDGAASLFLLNPHGILFGANARLDIAGSFTASTADSFLLPDGNQFSATNPQAPPLLTVNVAIGLQAGNTNPEAWLTNRANLSTGGNLALQAGKLDIQGQLQSGNTLTLTAQDSLTIRDSASQPFIAIAGGALTLQGNGIDIFALNHPGSGFWSGGDLTLRSPNPVIGDAHFSSGGNVRIEQLDGSLGDLISPNDPVIRASGDVTFTNYTGASLHIIAGGAVSIAGLVTITGADATNGLVETVALSQPLPDGTSSIAINGRTQPTLDVRAGTIAVGTPSTQGTMPPDLAITPTATNANITLNRVSFTAGNGLVFLSNQYQPNALPGAITVTNIDTRSAAGSGTVVIDARGNLNLGNLRTDALQNSTTNAGDITLIAGGAVTLEPRALLQARTLGTGSAGDITAIANSLTMPNQSQLDTSTNGSGSGGNITLRLTNALTMAGTNTRLLNLVNGDANATGGDITIQAGSLNLTNGAAIINAVQGIGTAGDINLDIAGNVLIDGVGNGSNSGIFAGILPNGEGQGGNVNFTARSLILSDGGVVATATFGEGDAGNITLTVQDNIVLTDLGVDKTLQDPDVPSVSGVVDVFFLSDVTGSMRGIINAVRQNASTVLNTLAGDDFRFTELDVNFGVGRYAADVGESRFIRPTDAYGLLQPITNDKATAQAAISRWAELLSGVATPEANFFALHQVATSGGSTDSIGSSDPGIATGQVTGWRDGAQRIIVWFGDAPSITTTVDLPEVTAALTSNDVTVLAINTQRAGRGIDQGGEASAIALATGGSLTNGVNAASVTDAILTAVGGAVQGDATVVNLPIGGVNSASGVYAGTSDGLVNPLVAGNGGQITIDTNRLLVQNGAQIDADALAGNAGNITISVSENISLVNNGSVSANGAIGGDINIATGQLQVRTNSFMSSSGISGSAGDITIQAKQGVTVSNLSYLNTGSVDGTGGNLLIESSTLLLQDRSVISSTGRSLDETQVINPNTSGNVDIRSSDSVTVESSSSLESSGFGRSNGGNVVIETGSLTVNEASINTNVVGQGQGGNLEVRANTVTTRSGAITTALVGQGSGGSLSIQADTVTALSDAENYFESHDEKEVTRTNSNRESSAHRFCRDAQAGGGWHRGNALRGGSKTPLYHRCLRSRKPNCKKLNPR